MGVYVQSRIIAERIESEAWLELYGLTLDFLSRCPLDLMGVRHVKGPTGTDRRVYTRAIEQHADDPVRRHWHVVGDFESFETGESFVLYADIAHYRRGEGSEPPEDVLQQLLADQGSWGNVFNDKTQGHPYHFAMLAVAMLIEERFPLYAFTSGNIDRAQAEEARRLLRDVLGLEVGLPLCVEGDRLLARIGRYVHGKEALERLDLIFRGERSELFPIAESSDLRAWIAARMCSYKQPTQLGMTWLAIDWLNADQELESFCRIACLDDAGPRFDPLELAQMLASTWLTVPEEARAALSPFRRAEGAQDTVHTQFGMAMMDMGGLSGRRIRRYIPREEALAVLARLFPEQAEPIRETIERRDAETVDKLEKLRAPVQELDRRSGEVQEIGDGRSFFFFETVDKLDESQRELFNGFALTARRLREMMAEELPISAQWGLTDLRGMLERACDACGLTLTEDAWAWIDDEDDRERLELLLVFAAMKEREQQFWNMRRALLERRAFAQAVLAASKDDALCAETEEMIRRQEERDRASS